MSKTSKSAVAYTSKSVVSPQILFLRRVAEESHGFRLAEPERVDEKSLAVVVPIVRQTSFQRQYVTYPEVAEQVMVLDTGRIDRFSVKNPLDKEVFVRSGTIFKGSTQERALVRSAVVIHGREQELEVRCVHASKGISRGAITGYGGVTPLSMDVSNYSAGFKPGDQGSYWKSVSNFSCAMAQPSAREEKTSGGLVLSQMAARRGPDVSRHTLAAEDGCTVTDFLLNSDGPARGAASDDLLSTLDSLGATWDDVLSKVKRLDNQVGMALISDAGLQTIELFDVGESWSALHKDAVKRVGDHLVKKDENAVFEYKPKNALNAVRAVLADEYELNHIFEHKVSNGDPKVSIWGLTSEKFVGELVEINEQAMHVVLNRRAALR